MEVMTNPMVLLLSAVYFLLKPTRYAIVFWGPKYVNARLGSGMMESGILSALFELAGPIGALTAGYLSDRLLGTRRVPVIVISLILLSVVLISFDHLPADRWMMGAGFFLIGLLLFAPDSLIAGTASVDFGTRRGASTASGLVNGFGSVGAVIGTAMFGLTNPRTGFLILGGMSLLAALIMGPRWNAVPKK
jgi:OPA family sugar phosphate sensor protein UhpC-like MFS transporter